MALNSNQMNVNLSSLTTQSKMLTVEIWEDFRCLLALCRCMEEHDGVKPKRWELEYCIEFKELFFEVNTLT